MKLFSDSRNYCELLCSIIIKQVAKMAFCFPFSGEIVYDTVNGFKSVNILELEKHISIKEQKVHEADISVVRGRLGFPHNEA